MNKLFFAIIALTIIISSCGNEANTDSNVHTHDDGSLHENHDNKSNTVPEQESFDIKNDSVNLVIDTIVHEEESDHTHSHEHGTEHKH